jgi:signal transduction histidine kinase
MAVTVGSALLVQSVLLYWGARRYLRADLERRARDYAVLTTPTLCDSYLLYHASGFFKLDQRVKDRLGRSEDVVSVRITDVTGNVVFDSGRGTTLPLRDAAPERSADPWILEALRTIEISSRQLPAAGGEPEFEVVSPYIEDWGRHQFSVLYRFSYRNLRTRLSQALVALGGLSSVATALAFGVGLLQARRISRPLAALTQRVQDIHSGRFSRRVEVEANPPGEIKILAEAFNAMARDLDHYVESLGQSFSSLEAVNAQLESKNAELERFAYTVSHDLKSPLITIRAYADLMAKDAAAGQLERLQADAGRIVAATEKMRRLLDDLLELSRIGRVANPTEDVALSVVAEEAAQLLGGTLAERKIELTIAPGLPVVKGDRARLLEVFQNLIENATKFMGSQPRPRIEIGVRDQGPERAFFVQDNGAGIAPRHHQKVFGLFDKLDPHSEGTGVGLALVKRIVEVHGGRVWVESDGDSHGACFYFTLPSPAK